MIGSRSTVWRLLWLKVHSYIHKCQLQGTECPPIEWILLLFILQRIVSSGIGVSEESGSYLIRPTEDGERKNARREPSVQNILVCNTGTKVTQSERRNHTEYRRLVLAMLVCALAETEVIQHLTATQANPTLSESYFVRRHVEAFCRFFPGLHLGPSAYPVMAVHVLEDIH